MGFSPSYTPSPLFTVMLPMSSHLRFVDVDVVTLAVVSLSWIRLNRCQKGLPVAPPSAPLCVLSLLPPPSHLRSVIVVTAVVSVVIVLFS